MSTFNPDTFLNTEVTEANSTSYVPVPEGEFVASIKEIKPRQAKDKAILDITWAIDDEKVAAETGMANPTVRQSLFLDVTESGGLDFAKGKNIGLGKLREALGQNAPGRPWAPGMLLGGVARVNVKHRLYEDQIFTDVKGVARV